MIVEQEYADLPCTSLLVIHRAWLLSGGRPGRLERLTRRVVNLLCPADRA